MPGGQRGAFLPYTMPHHPKTPRTKSRKNAPKPRSTDTQLMYHIYDYAPQPKRIGTGAQKYRRAKGKRSFHEGYRQPNM